MKTTAVPTSAFRHAWPITPSLFTLFFGFPPLKLYMPHQGRNWGIGKLGIGNRIPTLFFYFPDFSLPHFRTHALLHLFFHFLHFFHFFTAHCLLVSR